MPATYRLTRLDSKSNGMKTQIRRLNTDQLFIPWVVFLYRSLSQFSRKFLKVSGTLLVSDHRAYDYCYDSLLSEGNLPLETSLFIRSRTTLLFYVLRLGRQSKVPSLVSFAATIAPTRSLSLGPRREKFSWDFLIPTVRPCRFKRTLKQ